MRSLLLILLASAFGLSSLSAAPTPLPDKTRKALQSALDDEWKAQSYYKAVLKSHGEIRPFSNIVHAEGRHAGFLIKLMQKYGVALPTNRWLKKRWTVPSTLKQACVESLEAEKKNVALYDGFLATVKNSEVKQLMIYLRDASKLRHQRAFTRCINRGGRHGWRRGPHRLRGGRNTDPAQNRAGARAVARSSGSGLFLAVEST